MASVLRITAVVLAALVPLMAPAIEAAQPVEIGADQIPAPQQLLQAADTSPAMSTVARQIGAQTDRNNAVGARLPSGQEFVVIPAKGRPNTWFLFGDLPNGESLALSMEVLRGGRVRWKDQDGNGVEAEIETQGDQFRFKSARILDSRRGDLFDRGLEALGVGRAEAVNFICWSNCVMTRCPAWSWCYWRCGIYCGVCLASGIGCSNCVVCLGSLAFGCASACP